MSNRTASVHLVLLDNESVDLTSEVALQDSGHVTVTDVLNCFDDITLEKAFLLKDDGEDERGVFIGSKEISSVVFSPTSTNRLTGKSVPSSSAGASTTPKVPDAEYAAGIAAEMVKPLEGMVIPPANELKAVLDDHSGLQIPITQARYTDLAAHIDQKTMRKLKVVLNISMAEALGTYLADGMVELHSESTTTCTVQPLLFRLFSLLHKYTPLELPNFDFHGNRTKSGTSSTGVKKRSRPDMLGIVDSATLYVAEDKQHHNLKDAWADIKEYVHGGLASAHYGNVDYILGHVAAGPAFEFVYITAAAQVESASSQFALDSVAGRIKFVLTTMRVYQLLALLRNQLPSAACRTQPMFKVQERGATLLQLKGFGAEKTIHQFNLFCKDHHVTKESIAAAYKAASQAAVEMRQQGLEPFLVHALDLRFRDKRGGEVSYTVRTTPLGHSHIPSNEQELRSLAWACCKAAAALHAANLVHRDFRLRNVVRLKQQWLVIDLELCSFAPVVLPVRYMQAEWTSSTVELVDGEAHYTFKSDMRQIGVMLHHLRGTKLPAEANDFIRKLMDGALTAEAALQHPWLQGRRLS